MSEQEKATKYYEWTLKIKRELELIPIPEGFTLKSIYVQEQPECKNWKTIGEIAEALNYLEWNDVIILMRSFFLNYGIGNTQKVSEIISYNVLQHVGIVKDGTRLKSNVL